MNKIKDFFRLSIHDITIAAILTSLIIVSGKFLSINFGIMRVGITYALYIVIGLTLKPFLGIMIAIISDNILLMTSEYGLSNWIWAYAIIPLFIYFTAYFFKKIFTTKNDKLWWIIVLCSVITTAISIIILLIVKNDFEYKSNPNKQILMTNTLTKILVWSGFALIIISQIIFLTLFKIKPNNDLKMIISVFTLVSLIIIITIWIWGPIAQIYWLNRFGRNKNGYWKMYDIYLISRILKTPIILPLYTLIIVPLYKAISSSFVNKEKNKW